MTVVALALLSALGYGTADFIGGLTSRRTSVWKAAVVVQGSSTLCTAAAALLVAGSPRGVDLLWGAAAGVGSGAGACFLFRGLSRGRMSLVAPLSAVGSALIPVVVALVAGERPGLLAGLGVLVAVPAIWLVARPEEEPVHARSDQVTARVPRGLGDGLLAGLGFGTMFSLLGQVPAGAGLAPVTLTQLASTATAVALALAFGERWWPDRPSLRAAWAGPMGALALVAFLLASQSGLLTVAAVLSALYPAVTVLLAMTVLHERLRLGQTAGLGLCLVTVALMATAPA